MWSESSYMVSMTNCVVGSIALRRPTHSTPLSPGKLISTNTISGFSPGRRSSAFSALPWSLAQRKPGAAFTHCTRMARTSASSSIIETGTFKGSFYITPRKIVLSHVPMIGRHLNGRQQSHFRPPARLALDIAPSTNACHPPTHILHPVAARQAIGLSPVPVWWFHSEAHPIVADLQDHGLTFQDQGNMHLRCAGMLDRVVQRLLEREEQIVAH